MERFRTKHHVVGGAVGIDIPGGVPLESVASVLSGELRDVRALMARFGGAAPAGEAMWTLAREQQTADRLAELEG
ncbi:hypothetical protein [Desulfurivibrio dismutans]|uniref:hypothetical protein n=1 Tax=Desulfurivibrio dismutans TaxID=1398908 RepID=UPI0023DBA839|nr:hypothetical protein [Desulfurivibrio alkaliphilus]MDF1613845.1 hypothetical protein [Desulfurivibrio alkaliphilus]